MPAIVRRTATKVVDGQVTRKSRYDLTGERGYVIRKEPAGRGFTHVVSTNQLSEFLKILPGWPAVASRLGEIVLRGGSERAFGYHTWLVDENVAVIALHAWPKRLWLPLGSRFYAEHRHVLDALGVACILDRRPVFAKFTVAQARAFSLLHVFVHELGHHQDWLRRRGRRLPNVEPIAEDYANSHFDQLFPIYCEKFGDPRRGEKVVEALATPAVLKRVI